MATPMRIAAIDPGPKESAYVVFEYGRLLQFGKIDNMDLLRFIYNIWQGELGVVVVERICAQGGKRVGNETFQTAEWSGRFFQASLPIGAVFVTRIDAVRHVCKGRNYAGKADATVRAALIERFGKPGTAKAPGPTFGLTKDCWAALAVAVTWWDKNGGGK